MAGRLWREYRRSPAKAESAPFGSAFSARTARRSACTAARALRRCRRSPCTTRTRDLRNINCRNLRFNARLYCDGHTNTAPALRRRTGGKRALLNLRKPLSYSRADGIPCHPPKNFPARRDSPLLPLIFSQKCGNIKLQPVKKSILPAYAGFEITFLPRVSRGKKLFYPHKCASDATLTQPCAQCGCFGGKPPYGGFSTVLKNGGYDK